MKGLVAAGAVGAADGVDQRDAVVGEELRNRAEERPVVRRRRHARTCRPRRCGRSARRSRGSRRGGSARDRRGRAWRARVRDTLSCSSESVMPITSAPARLRKIERQARPSPSRCRARAGRARERAWRRCGASWRAAPVDRGRRRAEVGAGILPVGIEEELVNARIDVVVAGHVVTCAPGRVELQRKPGRAPEERHRPAPRREGDARRVLHHERDEVVDAAGLEGEAAAHIRFAGGELGVEDEGALDPPVGKTDAHRLARPVAEAVPFAGAVDECEVPFLDDLAQKQR